MVNVLRKFNRQFFCKKEIFGYSPWFLFSKGKCYNKESACFLKKQSFSLCPVVPPLFSACLFAAEHHKLNVGRGIALVSDPFILRSSIETATTSAFAWLPVSDSSVPQEREMQSLGSSVCGGEAGRDAGREGAAPRAGAAGCFGKGACACASWAEFLLGSRRCAGWGFCGVMGSGQLLPGEQQCMAAPFCLHHAARLGWCLPGVMVPFLLPVNCRHQL